MSSPSTRMRWFALIGLSLLAFTAFLDFTIVNTALPAIQIDLNAPVLKLQWVVNAYAIVISTLMIMLGKFGDIFGRRKIFYIGALIFIFAAFGAGFAQDINTLIFFRGVQGIAGAAMFILGVSLVPSLFPGENQQHAIGVYSAITGIGLGAGPFIAGVLISLSSWRWVFFINIPLIIIGFLMCVFVLKETEKQPNVKLDWLGFICLAVFIVTLLLGLVHGEHAEWQGFGTWLYFIVSAIAFIGLLITESKVEHPLLDLSIFCNRKLLLCLVICSMAGLVSYELFFFDPLYLSAIRHLTAFWIGLALLAVPGSQVIISLFWGKLSNKFNIPHIIVLALFCGIIAAVMHSFFGQTTSYVFIIIAFLLVGVVWGVGNAGGVGLAIQSVSNEKVGGTVGTIATTWNIMGSLSIAIGTLLFHSSERSFMKGKLTEHSITLTKQQHDTITTMLSSPTRAYQLLQQFTESKAHQILPYFKQAFLHGFKSAVIFAIIVLILGFIVSLILTNGLKKEAKNT